MSTNKSKTIDITVNSFDEITLTSSQPTSIALLIGTGLIYPTWAITIQNSQSDPTPSPFQLLLTLNLQNVISSATLTNLLSLLFCQDEQCTKPLYSWVESYNGLSSVNVWVLLPGGIPANSSITIYMAVTNKINYPYTGINAYYSTTYDNGPNVFDAYLNAMGTSIISTSTPQINSSVYSSIQFTAQSGTTPGHITMLAGQSGSRTVIYISAPNSQRLPEVFEGMGWYDGTADVQGVIGLADTSSSTFMVGVCGGTGGDNFSWEDSITGFWDPDDSAVSLAGAGDSTLTCSSPSIPFSSNGSAYNFYQVIATASEAYFNGATSSEPYEVDYSSIKNLISYSTSISAYGNIVAMEDSSGGASHTGYIYWFRARAYPPNGVMPSLVSFTQIS